MCFFDRSDHKDMMDEVGDGQQSQYSQCMSKLSSESYVIFLLHHCHMKKKTQSSFVPVSVLLCYVVKNIIHGYKMHECIFHKI